MEILQVSRVQFASSNHSSEACHWIGYFDRGRNNLRRYFRIILFQQVEYLGDAADLSRGTLQKRASVAPKESRGARFSRRAYDASQKGTGIIPAAEQYAECRGALRFGRIASGGC